jgi:SAM-dependent methyltransferase
MGERYGREYFDQSLKRNLAGRQRGDKWFQHHYWLRRLRKLVRPGARVLEPGCGLGFFASRVAAEFSVVSLDVSHTALSFVQQRWHLGRLVCANAENLPFRDKEFEAVIAFDLVEHLVHPELFLEEVARVLRDKGIFILTTPNPASIGARWKGKGTGQRRDHRWFGYRDETHVSIRAIEQWRSSFARSHMVVLEDGTDFLWDVPYFARVPLIVQKLFFIGAQWLGTFFFGFLPWHQGENYVAILRRRPRDSGSVATRT